MITEPVESMSSSEGLVSNGSVPAVSLTSPNGVQEPKLTVQFQCGLLREEETFIGYDLQIMGLDSLQEYVCDMLTFKVSASALSVCLSVCGSLMNIFIN